MRPDPLTRGVPLLAVLAILSACAAGGGETLEWTGTRERIGTVEVVRNPATPLLADGAARADRLWSTPETAVDDESPDSLWQDAASLALGGDTIFVLDRMAGRVYVVSARDGRQVATWGRKGRGPGELARPMDVMLLGTTAAVLDPGKGTIERFAPDGAMLEPIRLPGITFAARPLDSARLALGTMKGTEIFRPGGETTIVEPEPPVALPEDPPRGCRRLGSLGDAIVRIACIQPHLQILDTLGRGIREITLGLEPVPTADTTLDRFEREMRQGMASTNLSPAMIEQQVATTREAYRYSRRWRELRRDESSGMLAVWEQSPDDLEHGPATIHLLRPGGEWLARISFAESWTAFTIGNGTIYALARDPDTDVPRLVAYRLRLR